MFKTMHFERFILKSDLSITDSCLFVPNSYVVMVIQYYVWNYCGYFQSLAHYKSLENCKIVRKLFLCNCCIFHLPTASCNIAVLFPRFSSVMSHPRERTLLISLAVVSLVAVGLLISTVYYGRNHTHKL